jgi:hypothetical protein
VLDLLFICFAKRKVAKEKATSEEIAPRVRSSYVLASFGSIQLHGAVCLPQVAAINLLYFVSTDDHF